MVVIRLVDIGGIIDHHCIHFRLIITISIVSGNYMSISSNNSSGLGLSAVLKHLFVFSILWLILYHCTILVILNQFKSTLSHRMLELCYIFSNKMSAFLFCGLVRDQILVYVCFIFSSLYSGNFWQKVTLRRNL